MKTHPKAIYLTIISFIHICGIQAQNISTLSRQHEFIEKSAHRMAVQSFKNHPLEIESGYVQTLKLDSILWDGYRADLGYYKGLEKWTFLYNEQLDATSATYYYYNYIENKYIPEIKVDYSYNEDHTPKEGIVYEWEHSWDTDWIKFIKLNYEYDSKKNLKQTKYFMWADLIEQWYDFTKYDYDYDSVGNKIKITRALYINEQTWQDYFREDFTYDSINRLRFHEIFTRWGDTTSSWLKDKSDEFIYDTNGFTVFSNQYIYDIDILVGTNKEKHIYSFDENNNLSSYVQYRWDELNNQWAYSRRKIYTYDNAYDRNALLIPSDYLLNENIIISDFNFDFFNHMLTDMKSDLYSYDEWIPDYKGKFYYSEIIQTGIADLDSISVIVYPNPTDGIINIRIENSDNARIEIYNVSGTLLVSKALYSKLEKIDLSGFSKGVYLVKVRQDGTVIAGKVVVR